MFSADALIHASLFCRGKARAFMQKHPEAENVLLEWHSVVAHVEFRDFNHARE